MANRNYFDHTTAAICYRGPSRIKKAWLMGRGSYAYTCSFIGKTDPSKGEPVFTRWYAFKSGVALFWDYLWRKEVGNW